MRRPVLTAMLLLTVSSAMCAGYPGDSITPPTYTPVKRFLREAQHRTSLKTNMLYDALLIPNIGAEIAIAPNWSVGLSWMYAWWSHDSSHRYWRVYGGSVEGRYYLSTVPGRPMLSGHHFGLYASMITYDFEFGGNGQQAAKWNYSAGVGYGYSLPVSRHLDIDFNITVGYLGGRYHKYTPVDGHYVWTGTHYRHYIGPTGLEVSLRWFIDPENIRK